MRCPFCAVRFSQVYVGIVRKMNPELFVKQHLRDCFDVNHNPRVWYAALCDCCCRKVARLSYAEVIHVDAPLLALPCLMRAV